MASPAKKRTESWYRKKCVEYVKALARETGYCEYCGATKEQAQMQGSHIFPQEYHAICAEPRNIICLCANCHKWRKNSWHKGPEIPVWFYVTYPERYRYLNDHKEDKLPKGWWKQCYEHIRKTP